MSASQSTLVGKLSELMFQKSLGIRFDDFHQRPPSVCMCLAALMADLMEVLSECIKK